MRKGDYLMVKINGMTAFSAVVECVEENKVYFLLSDGSRGLMYNRDTIGYKAAMTCLFRVGQSVYVRKKKTIFEGMSFVTIDDLLQPEEQEDLMDAEHIGITAKTTDKGTIVQLTTCTTVFLWNVFLPKSTKVLVSVQQNREGKMRVYLCSVIYDDYIEAEPIFSLKYQPITICGEEHPAA